MILSDPPFTDIVAAKKAARAHAAAVRRAANAEKGAAAAEMLAVLFNEVPARAGDVVAGYWPMGDEIDVRPLMEALEGRGCRIALPIVTAPARPLEFRAWASGDPLVPGPHGTSHPVDAAPVLRPQVILVPLLAFDAKCFRLGYGGGYYDRTLEALDSGPQVRTIGIAFAAQQIAHVPVDRHDRRLDVILTETGAMRTEKA